MADNNIGNVEINFIVVWLDRDIGKSKVSRDIEALISQTVREQLKTFVNPDDCVDYILTEHTKRVFFITSGSFGHYIVPLIYQIPHIQTIYIFCANRQRAEEWAKPELKISGVFTKKKDLVEKIYDDIRACNNDSHLPMSIFHLADRQKSLRNLTEDSATFMWYQLLIVVLQRLADSACSKEEMIKECRSVYQNDSIEQKKISKFDKDYNRTKAIWWYTWDCFLYRLLNKALRGQDIVVIFRFRLVINDLHTQIKRLYLEYLKNHPPLANHRLTVYRGQHLGLDELNLLKQNVNGLISMNAFLSATLNRNLANIFAETQSPCTETSPIQSVLFIIDIFDMSKDTTPFASIKSHSCYEEEDEVLFTIGAVFKVQSVERVDHTWHIHLHLSKEQNELYRDLFEHIMKQIGPTPSRLTLGWFLRMTDCDKAERYTQALIHQLSPGDKEMGHAYNLLGLIHKDLGHALQAIECYKKALENYSRTSSPSSPQVIATHNNLGLAYLAAGDDQRASEHQQHAEGRLVNSSQTNSPLLLCMTDSLKANIDIVRGNYERAFRNLEEVLKEKQKNLPPGHLSFASTLKDMGIVQSKMGNDDKALEHLLQGLDISRKCLGSNHLDLAEYYANVGRVYYKRGEYSLALERFQTALDIITDVVRDDFDSIGTLNNCIAETEQRMSMI